MTENVFKYLFLIGLAVAMVIRTVYGVRYRRNAAEAAKRAAAGPPESGAAGARKQNPVVRFLMGLWGVAQILPIFYAFTPWLDFADYGLPDWTGWLGTAIFAAGLWLLWRSHADLGRNWSPELELLEGHRLVTEGVFKRIRHPMYAAHLLYALGQALMLHNWLAGLGGLVSFVPLYTLRMPEEEAMLLEGFGDEYRRYMQRTGRLFPKL